MSMVEPLLSLDAVSVSYPARRRSQTVNALTDVSLDVMPSETVGLVGESGSGKSTTALAVLGLAPIRSGTIRFDGDDITSINFRQRRSLAAQLQVVFQDPTSSLNPMATIGQTLAEPRQVQGRHDRPAIRTRISEMLERVGLPATAAERSQASSPADSGKGSRSHER